MQAAGPADSTAMRRVFGGVLLLALGMAPIIEAQPRPRLGAQISKRQLRKRYVAKPFNKKQKKGAKAKWGTRGAQGPHVAHGSQGTRRH